MAHWNIVNGKRFFKLITIALLCFYIPAILNHPYYKDDWDRATREIANFRALGRVFGSYFLHFLTSDYQKITETTPLFLLCSIVIIGASAWFALKIRNIPFNAITAVAVIAFLFNPFFLDCIFYRYDCLTMTIAMASGLLAWAFFPTKKVATFFLLVLSLSTYQPFINLFILLCLAELMYRLIHGASMKTNSADLAKAFLIYLASLVAYRAILIPLFSVKTGRSHLISLDSTGFSLVYEKIRVSTFVYSDFLSTTGKIIFGAALALALCGLFYLTYKYAAKARFLRLLICLFILALFLPLSYGPFLFLSDPVIGPRVIAPAIVFSVITIFLFGSFLYEKAPRWFFYLFSTLFLLCPLSFSYMAGHFLANQEKFETFIFSDLSSQFYSKIGQSTRIIVDGNLPYAPLNRGGVQRYRGLATIALPSQAWMSRLILPTYGLQNVEFSWDDDKSGQFRQRICQESLPPILTSQYFAFYQKDDITFIWMGEARMCPKP